MLRIGLLSVIFLHLCTGSAHSQNLTEHAAASTGAAMGTAAGKIVSNGMTAISEHLKGANGNAETSPGKPKPVVKAKKSRDEEEDEVASAKTKKKQPVAIAVGSGFYYPQQRVSARPERPQVYAAPVVEPVASHLSPEAVQSIAPGMSTGELGGVAGQFTSRITIPEEGHLVEVRHYQTAEPAGATVLVDNGVVVSVSESHK